MQFGKFELLSFVEYKFWLDGGSMFGLVPRSIWGQLIPPDENNLIPMVTNLFVLKAHGKNLLFDAGLGDTLTKREKKIYGTEGESAMESGLSSLGLTTDEIDYVFLSHLHTDHFGGSVKRDGKDYVPRFKNARYYVNKLEWESAMNPNERTAAVYIPERLQALENTKVVELFENDIEILPGVKTRFMGGHCEGHTALEIESEGVTAFYGADLFPSSHHFRVPYVSATDIYPLVTMEFKRSILPSLVDNQTVIALDHEVDTPFVRIVDNSGKLTAQPLKDDLVES